MDFTKNFKRIESPEYFAKYKEIFPDMDQKFMFNFARSMQMLHKVTVLTESYFNSVSLSKGRFIILVHLMVCDPVKGESISDLLPYYSISSATMTGLLDTLEKSDMIARLPNPSDRRKVNVRLTEKGREFMMEFLPKHQQNAKKMSTFLTENDRVMLPTILGKLIAGIHQYLSDDENDSNFAPGSNMDHA